MKIKFSKHADDRISERNIPKSRILATIIKPDQKTVSFKNRELRRKAFGSKILEVIVVSENETIEIVTAYYLRKESYEN